MPYQLALDGTPEAHASGATIVVSYKAVNNGDADTGGTWDKVLVADESGNAVCDSSEQVHDVKAGEGYQKDLQVLNDVAHGTYKVSLVLDSENASDPAWSGEVTVGS